MFTTHSRLNASPSVLFSEVDGEAVLLNQQTGLYYGLNEVGARIWSLVVQSRTLGEIQTTLFDDYDVAAEALWADVVRLATELTEQGLASS